MVIRSAANLDSRQLRGKGCGGRAGGLGVGVYWKLEGRKGGGSEEKAGAEGAQVLGGGGGLNIFFFVGPKCPPRK